MQTHLKSITEQNDVSPINIFEMIFPVLSFSAGALH